MSYKVRINDQTSINAPFKAEIERRIADVIERGRFIGGPDVEELEQKLAKHVGVSHAVGTGNGLDALRLALEAFVIRGYLKRGDKVMVPANTYIASVLAILHAGLVPVPVDVDPSTMVITAQTIERAFIPGVKALMPVHLYGRAVWDNDIKFLVESHNLIVIEDNAQAIGACAASNGVISTSRCTGALGHAAAFSFYPTKNIGAMGDGGAVTTNLPDIADTIKALGNYGSKVRFENIYTGYNSRLDPIQAAIVAIKLDKLDEISAKRQANAAALESGIKADYLSLPPTGVPGSMVWHQYVVTLEGISRDAFRRKMAEAKIETDIHYPLSPFLQPCLKGEYTKAVEGMNAVKLSGRIVSLPVSEALTSGELDYIIDTINTIQT